MIRDNAVPKIYTLIVIIFFIHSKLQAKVLNKSEATQLIYDMEIIREVAYRSDRTDDKKKEIFLKNKSLLLKKFKISNQDLMETLNYYFSHPTIFLNLYKQVLAKLNQNADKL